MDSIAFDGLGTFSNTVLVLPFWWDNVGYLDTLFLCSLESS